MVPESGYGDRWFEVEKVVDSFSEADRAKMAETSGKQKLQVEVSRLMDIIIKPLCVDERVLWWKLREGNTIGRAIGILEKEMAEHPAVLAQVDTTQIAGALQALGVVLDAAAFPSSDQRLPSCGRSRLLRTTRWRLGVRPRRCTSRRVAASLT